MEKIKLTEIHNRMMVRIKKAYYLDGEGRYFCANINVIDDLFVKELLNVLSFDKQFGK